MEHGENFLLFVGIIFALSALVRIGCKSFRLPPAVGYLCVGLALNFLNERYGFFSENSKHHLKLFSELGLMLLLFKVGIGSDVKQLIKQFKKALVLAASNFLISGFLGFLATYYVLQVDLLTSLFVGAALSATSVGVTSAVWSESGQLKSSNGSLLIDMAEIDDILGILAMIILFALAPRIANGESILLDWELVGTILSILVKTVILVTFCYSFAKYVEPWISQRAEDADSSYMFLCAITVGVCTLISYLSVKLGFSIAVGAFFAGLAYSKDPNENKIENGLELVYLLLVPFFFVGISMAVDLAKISEAIMPGIILSVVAIAGKIIGVVLPAKFLRIEGKSLLLGVSMIPRAEIALVIMVAGVSMPGVNVSSTIYISVIFVSIVTCVMGPLWTNYILQRQEP